MTRTIKFRAWDTVSNTMAHFPGAYIHEDGHLSFSMMSDSPSRNWKDGLAIERGEIILMQFTGLLDKNGKEIYEGDILKTSDTGNLFEVIFDDKAASFKIVERSNTYAKNRKWMMGWDAKRRAIIGNIYENLSLLQ